MEFSIDVYNEVFQMYENSILFCHYENGFYYVTFMPQWLPIESMNNQQSVTEFIANTIENGRRINFVREIYSPFEWIVYLN